MVHFHQVRLLDPNEVGKKWAGLVPANIELLRLNTMGDLLNSTHPLLYLHDAPMHRMCPAAMRNFHSPRYFPYDYRHFHGTDAARMDFQWPSFFVARKGTSSGLHTDATYVQGLDWRRTRTTEPSDFCQSFRSARNVFCLCVYVRVFKYVCMHLCVCVFSSQYHIIPQMDSILHDWAAGAQIMAPLSPICVLGIVSY
jgi:hypothetical protein